MMRIVPSVRASPGTYGQTALMTSESLAQESIWEGARGGMGGPQTRAFILFPADLPLPDEPIVGAAAVHGLLRSWRQHLHAAA